MPEGGIEGVSGADLLSQEVNSLSLARSCFTVLFGKGRGGSKTLWAPDETDVLDVGLFNGFGSSTWKKVKVKIGL